MSNIWKTAGQLNVLKVVGSIHAGEGGELSQGCLDLAARETVQGVI